MPVSRRQIVTGLSVVCLLTLTVLAGYALHSCNKYHLPIPNAMSALTIALPPLAGVAIETCIALRDKLEARGQLQSSRILPVIMGIFLVYEAVLATLAGTHISPPGSLDCALRETWQHMFRTKDEASVRLIQSAFACCGFGSLRDMAWPFPDAQHGSDACVVRYERDVPCIGPWRGEERKVAILLLVVPLAVFVWMTAIVLSTSPESSWLPSRIRLPGNSHPDSSGRRTQPAISYRDVDEVDGAEEADSIHREVSNLNSDSQLATHVEGNRSQTSGLRHENDVWGQEIA